MPSAEFEAAVAASRNLKEKPTDDELLQIYALFKQAKQDPKYEDAPAPGAFDFKGKYKQKAWKKVVDEGVTPEQAETKYVALIEEFKKKYGVKEA